MSLNTYTRRHFLHTACAFGATALAASLLPTRLLAAPLAEDSALTQETRLLMGTVVTITAHGSSASHRTHAVEEAFAAILAGVAIFDRRNPASALGALNTAGSLENAPAPLLAVLEEARILGLASGHLFNPAIQPVVDLLTANKTTKQHIHVDAQALAHAMSLADPAAVSITGGRITLGKSGMGLTLDGIAKGHIADTAAAALTAAGIANHMVNAGGDIRVSGLNPQKKPWRIGIENPMRTGHSFATVALSNTGIATSGGYENYFDASRQTHHLVNPRTGTSPKMASVTVVAPTTMQADALATTLAFMPPSQAVAFVAPYKDTACLIIGRSGERYASPSWRG